MAEEIKGELISNAKALPAPMGGFSLAPRTFDEAFRFANLMAESTLLPPEFRKQPANVLVAVQLGMELGVSPMQALQNMYVINGRPSIYGDLVPAIVFNSGLMETFHEEGDEKSATCTVKRKGIAEPVTRTFTWADAERAGLIKRNPTYTSYPKRMLQMRARSWALRDLFPDVLKGVAIKEEAEDFIDTTATETKENKPIALPQPKKETVNVDQHRGGESSDAQSRTVEPGNTGVGTGGSSAPTGDAVQGSQGSQETQTQTPKEKVNSRSVQRRQALQKGQPMPEFGGKNDGNEPINRPAAGDQGSGDGQLQSATGDQGANAPTELVLEDMVEAWIAEAKAEEFETPADKFKGNWAALKAGGHFMRLLAKYNDRKQAVGG